MDIQTTEVKTEIPVTITELEVSREVSKLLNNPKPIVPRIDHEWFQAELPPFGNKDATTPSPDQLNLGMLSNDYVKFPSTVYMETSTRNLFSAHLCPSTSWTQENIDIPLETDEMIIDYLSKFDGDADKAYFSLMVELGSGKEHVFSQRAVDQVKRHSAGTTFMECRERYLVAPPSAAAGMLITGAADSKLSELGNDAVKSPHSLARSRYLGGKSPAQVGLRPLCLSDDSPRDAGMIVKEEIATEAQPLVQAPEAIEVPQVSEGRIPGNRTAGLNNDKETKNSIRKEWQAVYKQVSELLARCAGPRNAPILSGTKAVSEEEALTLLQTAAMLPTYINSPGECFAETVRTALGELLLHCATTHKWCIDVRDALYDSVVPPVTLSRFTALLNESRSLRVTNEPVLKQLQQIVSERSTLSREVRQLDRFVRSSSEDVMDDDDAANDNELVTLTLKDVRNFLNRDAKLPRAGALHGHTTLLTSIVSNINGLAQSMDTIIMKAEICSVRKQRVPLVYWRSSGDSEHGHRTAGPRVSATEGKDPAEDDGFRTYIDVAREVRARVESLPVSFPQFKTFVNILESAESWRSQVQQLIDSDAADEHQSARSKSKAQSSQGHGRAVSLKRVEALIEEGERQAFAFPIETKYLAEKRQRARDWLEKLKKNFQIRSGGSLSRASLRKGASSADNNQMPAEKMTLSDMKMMVEEGNLLLEDPEGDQSELQANRTTQARELNKAQNAVSIAEEWLSRARELLAESYLSLDDDYPQKRQAQRDQARLERAANRAARAVNNAISSGESMDEVTQMEVNGKGDEEDDGDEDDEEQDVKEMLRDMLGEADEMPVQLDEAAVLRVHLRALDWVVKARKVLPSPTVSTSVNTSEMDLESKQKPIFVDAQKLLTEIQNIRDELDEDIAEDFGVKALPEEDQCTQIVKEAEIVIAAAKKLLQGSSIRKGSRLLRVVSVLADASKLSVTLQNELRPLKLAVATAEQWLSAHTGILKNLGIQCDLSQVDIEAAARSSILVGDGDDEDVVNTGTSVANDVIEAGDAIVALNELNQAIQSAESVVLEFPELKALRQRFNRVNQWRTQVKERTAVSAIVKPKPSSAVHVQELLDEGRGLRILLPNDFDSLNLLAERISEWDKSVGSTLDAMATDVMSLVEQYSSVGSSAENIRGLGFSFLTGTDPGLPEPPFLLTKQIVRMTVETTGKKPMSSDAELQLWEQVLTLRKSLDDLATQGTTHGMIAQRTVDLSLGLATTDWLAQTRSLFVSKSLVKSMAEGRSKSASESAAIVWADVNRTSIKNLVRDCEWILQAYQAQTSGEKELFPILSCFNAASLADDLEVDKSTSNRIALLETFFPGVADDLFSFDEDLGEDEDDGRGRTSRRAPAKRSLSPVNEDPVKSATKPSRSKKVSETVEIVAVEEDSGRASKSKRKANEPESKRLNVSKDQSKSGKRSRKDETALTENKDEEEEHNADEEEDDDDTKEAAKPISANFLTSLKRQVVSSLSSNDEQELVCQQLRQSFVGLVDFWYRLLHFLYLRLNETAIWDKKMRKLLQKGSELGTQAFGSSLSGDTASEGRDVKITPSLGIKLLAVHELYGQIESCLREAQARGLYSLQRLEVESNCLEITEYFRTVNDMFVKRQGLLKIPELLTFVKRGEGLLVLGEGICGFSVSQSKDNELSSTDEAADGMDVDEDKDGAEEVVESSNTFVRNPVGFFLSVAKLKLDLRTAKSWVTRFQAQSNAAGADALVAEASKLAVDLSEYLEIVQATVECYCFCRLGSHGQMIGCDLCAEWYHYSCVGITPVQAEKIEKYVCLRCNLRSMFNETARLAATLTNRWMRPSELAKHRDLRRNKAEKKRSKEEKDLAALERQTATLKDRRELVGAVLAANGEGEFPQLSELDVNQILTAGQAAQDAVDHQLTQLSIAITEVAQRVKRAVAEEEQVVRQIQMELSHRQAATEWMLAMQGVMWPSNREDLDIGRPISPHAIFPADESLSITFSAETLGMQDGLLSAGMLPAFEAAKVLRIDEIEDVREVFEAFRYMSWLNITLHCLRRPLPTYAYRLILRSAQSLSWADEKVIKAIALQLSRASTWKSKARKLIQSATFQSSGYWVEAIKLRVLVEESAGLPFTSRLKDRLSILVAEHHAKYPPPPIIGGDSSAGSGPGRKKASASIPQPSTHIRLIDIPEASLSDDEGEGFDTNLPSLTYVYPSGLKPTPALDQLWPPTLNFERARSNLPPPPLTRPAPTPSTTNETVVENEAMDETGNGNGNDVEDGNDIENGNDVKPNVEESTTDLPVKSDEEMES